MIILAMDPSGSYKYGSGTTGWCMVSTLTREILELDNIKAKHFKTKEEYIKAHDDILELIKPETLVIENFILYQGTAATLYNQELETSELIGYICGKAKERGINIVRQNAQLIKTKMYKPHILLNIVNQKKEQLVLKTTKKDRQQWIFNGKRISNHMVDSIRHAFYYITRENQKENKDETI